MHHLSSVLYWNSERTVVWQQCLLNPICSNVWQSCCFTEPSASKTLCSKPLTNGKSQQPEFTLFCSPLLRSALLILYTPSEWIVFCALAMCCSRDFRAKTKSCKLCGSTISNIKGRDKKYVLSFFRTLSGRHHLFHFACVPRDLFYTQAQIPL